MPEDWLARQIARLDIVEGDVATLSGRLAQVRTWTYAAHRPGWVKDSAHWQEQTRAVEDRLSDALHERLTQRFIDRRTSVLMRHLREDDAGGIVLDDSGGVAIGGEIIGKLDGFRFTQAESAAGIHERALRAAAMKGLEGEFLARAGRLANASDRDITLTEHGRLWWDGAIVAKLTAGSSPLAPAVALLADENLKGEVRAGVQRRLEEWLTARIAAKLEPLLALRTGVEAKAGTAGALPAMARGIAHQLCENFGSLETSRVALPSDRRTLIRALRPYGVWFGRRSIYLTKLLRPDAASLLALLWGVWTKLEQVPALPRAGLTSFVNDANAPEGFLSAAGFRVIAGRAIRLDMLERIEDVLEKGIMDGAAAEALIPKLVSLLGSSNDELFEVLSALGWQRTDVAGETAHSVWRRAQEKRELQRRKPRQRESQPAVVKDLPFAGLAGLIGGK